MLTVLLGLGAFHLTQLVLGFAALHVVQVRRIRRGGPSVSLRRRYVALLQPPARRCRECQHFDLPGGQAQLRAHPIFMAVAEVITPDKMHHQLKHGEQPPEGAPLDEEVRQRLDPGRGFKWEDYGECTLRGEGVHDCYGCKDWS